MEPELFHILYFGITSIALFLVYRAISNRTGFNKIKKYLDLRENDFSHRYRSKVQNLEDASIHFEIDLKTSGVLIDDTLYPCWQKFNDFIYIMIVFNT